MENPCTIRLYRCNVNQVVRRYMSDAAVYDVHCKPFSGYNLQFYRLMLVDNRLTMAGVREVDNRLTITDVNRVVDNRLTITDVSHKPPGSMVDNRLTIAGARSVDNGLTVPGARSVDNRLTVPGVDNRLTAAEGDNGRG